MKWLTTFLWWGLIALTFSLVAGIVWVSSAGDVFSSEPSQSVTGIPVDVLLSIISALVALIYADMRRAIRRLEVEGAKRTRSIDHLSMLMHLVCRKLNIPYSNHIEEES